MRVRLGAPLAAAVVGLFWAASPASAAFLGATKYANCSQPCCDAQCCYSSCAAAVPHPLQLVYDTVQEKRWHTCYQTVSETVMKPVCKTCYRTEQKTCYKTVKETCYRTEECQVQKPCYSTVMKECQTTECCPVMRNLLQGCYVHRLQAGVRDRHEVLHGDRVQAGLRNALRQALPQVCKQICECSMRECCETVCSRSAKRSAGKCCQTVCRQVCETCMKDVCCTTYKDVCETCTKDVCKTVCEPCCTTKCVTKLHSGNGVRAILRAGQDHAQVGSQVQGVLRPVHLPDDLQAHTAGSASAAKSRTRSRPGK